MSAQVPVPFLKELRQRLASAIADFKAYDVPRLCVRLGLAGGTDQEAFSSKFRYAMSRLSEVDVATILGAARRLLEEEENFQLAEIVARIDDLSGRRVTELTRRRIVGVFDRRALCTELPEIDLIRRLWPIAQMPSPYSRPGFDPTPLEADIIQHTVRNDDWTTKELLEAVGILNCSQKQFFRFLNAVTDPVVQTPERQAELVEGINAHLKHDGYILAMSGRVSGSPIYEVRPAPSGTPADDAISAALRAFDPEHIHERWMAALDRRASDPAGAITLARTLLEDVCKWVLTQAGDTFEEKDDLPVLYRRLAKVLKLAPDDHTEQVFKQILGSCQSIVESLGALRNKLSDAHSPGPKRARAQPRHAELAVNLAGTMATFLVATWQARRPEGRSMADDIKP
jgi:hypothetical protein